MNGISLGIIEALGWEHDPAPWTTKAACADSNPELFFPERGGSSSEAKHICRRCPVQLDCLEYALRWNIKFGIWGGRGEPERKRLRRQERPRRLPPAHGTTTRARTCNCDACRAARRQYELGREYLFESEQASAEDIRPSKRYL